MFFTSRLFRHLRIVVLTFGVGLTTAACTDGYGYGGVDAGYALPYYRPGYGYGGYGNAGFGGFGWYGDYYYPGTGIYVYDRNRRSYHWNDSQRRYWEGRRGQYRGDGRGEWGGFVHRGDRDGHRTFRGNVQGFHRDATPPLVGTRARERGDGFRSGHRNYSGRSFGGRSESRGGFGGGRVGGGRRR